MMDSSTLDPARDRIAALLGGLTRPGAFSARRTASPDDLHLEVRGVGEILLPVSGAQAEQLCDIGRPAAYGMGTETLLNPQVRDTWEIPKSRVKIDKRRWDKTLLPLLERLRADLGLPSGSRLEAELNSMLVYAPGQFFASHQDSEKADAMVGSLVVTLPGSFRGGALVVDHGGETATYRGSKQSLSLVAFYADCHHQIRPVTSGYRVVLTYNLLLRGESASPVEVAPASIDELARLLDDHFTTPGQSARPVGGTSVGVPPNRLVYFLDHEYTHSALSWSRLKSHDAERASALRAAGTLGDCEVVLALADIHEIWSCFEAEWGPPRYSRWGRSYEYDDEVDDAVEPDDHELEELIDWTITLDCWQEPSGDKVQPIATRVRDFEACSTTPSAELVPYASEYEGYMGNYGNTLDRWYHRGAVVLWPRQRAFAVRAEASATWALAALSSCLRAGHVGEAQEMATTLAPFWDGAAGSASGPKLFTSALRVAKGLDRATTAAMLLRPFRIEMLKHSHAAALVALAERYGDQWMDELLEGCSAHPVLGPTSKGQDREAWVASLPRLSKALHSAGNTGSALAGLLTRKSWSWLGEQVQGSVDVTAPSWREKEMGELGPLVTAVLASAATIGATSLRDEVVGLLCQPNANLTVCSMQALRAAAKLQLENREAAGLDAIARHCTERLEARLGSPERGADDWSIAAPGGCSCERCEVLDAFLRDRGRRAFEWPLAKEGRLHVHGMLDYSELPVTHQTRRSGSPYTLVLTKTEAIFVRERQARTRDQSDLAWLQESWGV